MSGGSLNYADDEMRDGFVAMNSIKTLRDKLLQRFPEGNVTLTEPLRAEDVWTLDFGYGALNYVIEWLPPARFGVSSVSDASAFGGGPDEVFSNIEDAYSRLVSFVTTTQRPL
jgi:hypothetical protein